MIAFKKAKVLFTYKYKFLSHTKNLYWIYKKVIIPFTDKLFGLASFDKTINIDFNNKYYWGVNAIKISDFFAQDMIPLKLTLIAKSKYGKGTITLFDGCKKLKSYIVKGHSKYFYNNEGITFYGYDFNLTPECSLDNLHYQLKGKFIIKGVNLKYNDKVFNNNTNYHISDSNKRMLYQASVFKRFKKPICEFPWKGRIIITATGDLYPCCNTFLSIDNLKKKNFFDLWNSKKFQNLRAELLEGRFPEICKSESCKFYCNSLCKDSNKPAALTQIFNKKQSIS